MQGKTRTELYKQLLDFITLDIQRERRRENRRLLNVFVWCFILPAITSALLILLIKMQILPRAARGYLDWTILVFPVSFSLYLLGSEVLNQIPATIRRGAVASLLNQATLDSTWRERVCESMVKAIDATADDWKWLVASFRIDLERMHNRTRYLTALAGAVFYLLIQGIDSLAEDTTTRTVWIKSPMGLIEASPNEFGPIIGLLLFLVLFYLSGSQTHHSLTRYLNCADLVRLNRESRPQS